MSKFVFKGIYCLKTAVQKKPGNNCDKYWNKCHCIKRNALGKKKKLKPWDLILFLPINVYLMYVSKLAFIYYLYLYYLLPKRYFFWVFK